MDQDFTAKYLHLLEEMLGKVKENLILNTTGYFNAHNVTFDNLDEYIKELNSYYYRSFHEHFFPAYRKTIVTDLEELLQIKKDQDMIIQDLLANLKRYAKLYNQIKVVNKLLKETREIFNSSLYAIYREKEYQNTELLYSLRNLHNALNALQVIANTLTTMYDDKNLVNAVKLYPNMPRVLVNTSKLAPYELDSIKRLTFKLQVILKLVQQLEATNISKKIVQDVVADFTAEINAIHSNKIWPSLPKSFVNDFDFKAKTFTELITSYNELNKLDKIRTTAKDYENMLYNFLIVLDQGLDFLDKNNSKYGADLLGNTFAISDLSYNSLSILNQKVSELIGTLDRIQDNIINTGEPDFSYLAKTIEDLLENYRSRFQKLIEQEDLMQVTPLAKQLNIVNLEFTILDRHLHLLKDKRNFAKALEEKYLDVINILDSYLSFISNTRGDLERLLAPRNLSRAWKGFNVKVERIPTEVGKKLPAGYEHILTETSIERKISHLDTDTILHEEGDIFIITIDDKTLYEIPPLILAQKG
ncbi:MAG: hypothetical protein GX790_04200 [Syntrophomonadaceae bacterium]|nr:hypothetical protein [Syntrophomonadaceae bacterium]